MVYQGSCHCGRIAFEVEAEMGPVIDCNCSICRRKGSLLWFVPRSQLKLLTPEENLSTYKFNREVIKHHFCSHCGIGPLGMGTDAEGKEMAAVNVRCLEGVELAELNRIPFDGQNA